MRRNRYANDAYRCTFTPGDPNRTAFDLDPARNFRERERESGSAAAEASSIPVIRNERGGGE
jgi:hypothetical protein